LAVDHGCHPFIQDLAALEEEKKNLKANLDESENRNTKLELAKRALEGDIQRTKLVLNDKDTEIAVSVNHVSILSNMCRLSKDN